MDATEHDADIYLYKASGELLSEVQIKIPLLVRRPGENGKIRHWVLRTKLFELTNLLDRFQEWPQLLDPILANLVQHLVDSFLEYCLSYRETYLRASGYHGEILPLPRAVCHVLCALCKVRGQKVIVRLLNNEPKYVEPLLTCFRMWSDTTATNIAKNAGPMVWEEQYIMLLWLSHLMLAPFELSSISGLSFSSGPDQPAAICPNLPPVAQNILSLALDHLYVASKAREAASTLIVRLALRADMQARQMPSNITNWAADQLLAERGEDHLDTYHHIGLLSLLFGMINSASDSESAPLLRKVLSATSTLAASDRPSYQVIRDQAPSRKLLVKIMRAAMIHSIAISSTDPQHLAGMDVDSALEECIQILLDLLADKDTPVRQATSKALSMITLKLEPEMSAEVIEAVLGALNENLLLEDLATGKLVPGSDILSNSTKDYKKNVNAVDALRWHGAMLTLGHLLFRRSPPREQLSSIIEALLVGLEFEQRSNVGTSIGVGVRDAACFGIWSLARKYSTSELAKVTYTASMLSANQNSPESYQGTVIQLIATRLVVSACLDTSGNIRRGSSAALQELIGRHPDVVSAGIPVVQVVDYNAVARRSRAVQEVAVAAASLDEEYRLALLYSALGWRGARATDAESRRVSSKAIGLLISTSTMDVSFAFLRQILSDVLRLKPSNIGSSAAARHGLLLSAAEVLNALTLKSRLEDEEAVFQIISPLIEDLQLLTGNITGRTTKEMESVLEAVSQCLMELLVLLQVLMAHAPQLASSLLGDTWLDCVWSVLDRCTGASDKDKELLAKTAASANIEFLRLTRVLGRSTAPFLERWLNAQGQKSADFTCKGRIITLSSAYQTSDTDAFLKPLASSIVAYLCNVVEGDYKIETRSNSMESVQMLLSSQVNIPPQHLQQFNQTLQKGLSDYTSDQRGDIGSSLRLASIAAAHDLAKRDLDVRSMLPIIRTVSKLAAEKLTKVRFHAWNCLGVFIDTYPLLSTEKMLPWKRFEHQADVSSLDYYQTLLKVYGIPELREPLILGLISSAAAGTEDISRASTGAIVAAVLQHDSTQRRSICVEMLAIVLTHLKGLPIDEDKEAVPAIDYLAFMFEHLLPLCESVSLTVPERDEAWATVQRMHAPSSSLLRLESLLRLYTVMLAYQDFESLTLDRLTRLLLHKWPKMRSAAADGLFFRSKTDALLQIDWHAPVAANKSEVISLRKLLGVNNSK